MLRSRICVLILSSLFPAFFFLKLTPAFSVLGPAFFFYVPEFSLLPSDVFPAISSVILFALPPAFLFRFAFCGADHSSKFFYQSPIIPWVQTSRNESSHWYALGVTDNVLDIHTIDSPWHEPSIHSIKISFFLQAMIQTISKTTWSLHLQCSCSLISLYIFDIIGRYQLLACVHACTLLLLRELGV